MKASTVTTKRGESGRLMRLPLQTTAILVWWFAASISLAQHPAHKAEEREQQAGSVLVGKLVDSTWFDVKEDRQSEKERIARASANLANGVPAAIIAEDSEEDEKGLWLLLTNSAGLAAYAGKQVKVEGRLLRENRGIIPTTISVADAGTWRQVQLAPPPKEPATVESAHAEHAAEQETAPSRTAEPKKEEARDEHETEPTKMDGSAKAEHEGHEAGHEPKRIDSTRKPGDERGGKHEHSPVLALPPAHPLLVNFTAGLLPAAVLAEWLGRLLRRRSLTHAAWWMLCFGALITPLTAVAGWLWFSELGEMGHPQIHVHKWLGTSLAIVLVALAIWRARIYARDGDPGPGYLTIVTVVLLAVVVQGHLGATMSFGSHGSDTAEASHEH